MSRVRTVEGSVRAQPWKKVVAKRKRSFKFDDETLEGVARQVEANSLESSDMSVGRLNYKFSFDSSHDSKGRLLVVNVKCLTTLYMPTWSKRKQASKADRKEWARFWKALLEHEKGHYLRAVTSAKAIRNQLVQANASTIKAVFAKAKSAADLQQSSYDAATEHGIKQKTKYGSTTISVGGKTRNQGFRGNDNKKFQGRVRQRKQRAGGK
jgi:hypothetical protein